MQNNSVQVNEISVILVDEEDKELGTMEKLKAHEKGLLHRAISVFLFDENGNWLLQKRADSKYHSPGRWSNTACSHPFPGEESESAAHRRLQEEMGLQAMLTKAFHFKYHIEFENGLQEHELDHIFVGITNKAPTPDPLEVSHWKSISHQNLRKEIEQNPENFTGWFLLLYERVWNFVKK